MYAITGGPAMSGAKLAYSVDDACTTLSIGRTLLFDLIRRGELTSVKIGRRRLVPVASLEAYVARLAKQG
jgi:excisionase family DNA binding protein